MNVNDFLWVTSDISIDNWDLQSIIWIPPNLTEFKSNFLSIRLCDLNCKQRRIKRNLLHGFIKSDWDHICLANESYFSCGSLVTDWSISFIKAIVTWINFTIWTSIIWLKIVVITIFVRIKNTVTTNWRTSWSLAEVLNASVPKSYGAIVIATIKINIVPIVTYFLTYFDTVFTDWLADCLRKRCLIKCASKSRQSIFTCIWTPILYLVFHRKTRIWSQIYCITKLWTFNSTITTCRFQNHAW